MLASSTNETPNLGDQNDTSIGGEERISTYSCCELLLISFVFMCGICTVIPIFFLLLCTISCVINLCNLAKREATTILVRKVLSIEFVPEGEGEDVSLADKEKEYSRRRDPARIELQTHNKRIYFSELFCHEEKEDEDSARVAGEEDNITPSYCLDTGGNDTLDSSSSRIASFDATQDLSESLAFPLDIELGLFEFPIDAIDRFEEAEIAGSQPKGDDSSRDRGASCDICFEDFEIDEEVARSTNRACTHFFHKDCILNWVVINPSCPSCRQTFVEVVPGGKTSST